MGIKLIKARTSNDKRMVKNMVLRMMSELKGFGVSYGDKYNRQRTPYLIVENGAVLGTFSIIRKKGHYPGLFRLYIKPHYRRKGIGKRLFIKLGEIMLNYGSKTTYFWCDENNEVGHKFYSKLDGCEKDGEIDPINGIGYKYTVKEKEIENK